MWAQNNHPTFSNNKNQSLDHNSIKYTTKSNKFREILARHASFLSEKRKGTVAPLASAELTTVYADAMEKDCIVTSGQREIASDYALVLVVVCIDNP